MPRALQPWPTPDDVADALRVTYPTLPALDQKLIGQCLARAEDFARALPEWVDAVEVPAKVWAAVRGMARDDYAFQYPGAQIEGAPDVTAGGNWRTQYLMDMGYWRGGRPRIR